MSEFFEKNKTPGDEHEDREQSTRLFGVSQYDASTLDEDDQLRKLLDMLPDIEDECGAVEEKHLYSIGKRAFDIFASALALLLLSPLFLLVSIIIRCESPGRAIFRQKRVGKGGQVFTMYKFRSMCVDAEKRQSDAQSGNVANGPMFKNPSDPRITRFGAKIRKYNIDELPQLCNILTGKMSFIGPRPPLIKEVIQYEKPWTVRLAVKGGLSCYWQVYRTREADFEECLEMDKKYIEKRSWLTDLKLIFMTIGIVPKGVGH